MPRKHVVRLVKKDNVKLYIFFCYSEQCHNLISTTYKTSCKNGEGIEEMFSDIAHQLVQANRSKLELQTLDKHGFKITTSEEVIDDSCLC